MPIRITTLILAAASATLFSGCALHYDAKERVEKVETIDTNLYLYTIYQPYETRLYMAREYAQHLATEYCRKINRGSQPIESTTNFRDEGGIDTKLVFRCVQYLPTPVQPFEDHNEGGS